MDRVEGARTFEVAGASYDAFMGRYAAPLAPLFADAAGVADGGGQRAVDVGCGPGALTGVLAQRLSPAAVLACDPSASFVEECARRHPGVGVRPGRAEALPFGDGEVDVALCQLVLHFVSDAPRAVREMRRVVGPRGTVAACVWDFADNMEMLRAYWDAALEVDPAAPAETRSVRLGEPGEIAGLFRDAGLRDVEEGLLRVRSTYAGFDDLWDGFLTGVGPAGSHLATLTDPERDRLRAGLHRRLGEPAGPFSLGAVARCVVGQAGG